MKRRFGGWMALGSLAFLMSGACAKTTASSDCTVGTERCECYRNDTCDSPFVCLSSLCVLDDRHSGDATAGRGSDTGMGGSPGAVVTRPRGVGGDNSTAESGAPDAIVSAGTGGHPPEAGAPSDGGVPNHGGDGGVPSDGGAASDCVDQAISLPFVDIGDLPAPGNAAQLIYAPHYQSLVLRNAASAVYVVDAANGTSSTRFAHTQFTDLSLSPDGRYVFAADYGGENIGYGTPFSQSYVHRLDLADGSWSERQVWIAGAVEATSSDHFVLKSLDQWVTFTYDAWSEGLAASQLSSTFAGVYYGDFAYDWRTKRLIHGNTGSSSQEVQAFKLLDDKLIAQEGTGIYGSASGFGGTATLATDGSVFYYGKLSLDAQDVTHTLGVFAENIHAATGAFAFGSGTVYDAHSRDLLANLGVVTTVYGLNPNGSDLWLFDSAANQLRHFAPTGWCGSQ